MGFAPFLKSFRTQSTIEPMYVRACRKIGREASENERKTTPKRESTTIIDPA